MPGQRGVPDVTLGKARALEAPSDGGRGEAGPLRLLPGRRDWTVHTPGTVSARSPRTHGLWVLQPQEPPTLTPFGHQLRVRGFCFLQRFPRWCHLPAGPRPLSHVTHCPLASPQWVQKPPILQLCHLSSGREGQGRGSHQPGSRRLQEGEKGGPGLGSLSHVCLSLWGAGRPRGVRKRQPHRPLLHRTRDHTHLRDNIR